MSAPDQKEWKVTEDEIDAIHESAYEDWNGQNIDRALIADICEAVARRRALAELRALAKTVCFACGQGRPSREVEPDRIWGHIQHSSAVDCEVWSPHFWCEAQEIRDRIAAIEAEDK